MPARNINLASLAIFAVSTGDLNQLQVLFDYAVVKLSIVPAGDVASVPPITPPDSYNGGSVNTNVRGFMEWIDSVEPDVDSIKNGNASVIALAGFHNTCLSRVKSKLSFRAAAEAATEDKRTASEIIAQKEEEVTVSPATESDTLPE